MKFKSFIFIILILLSFSLSCSRERFQSYVYSKKEANTFSTYDWSNYHPENRVIRYSLEYPNNWSLDGSVFHDQTGQKIGELLPGVVLLKKEQKLLQTLKAPRDDYNDEEEGIKPKIISKRNIHFGKYRGVLIVESTAAMDDQGSWIKWYPNIYYLQDKNKVFIITFYERKLNSRLRSTFDKIVKTFNFIE